MKPSKEHSLQVVVALSCELSLDLERFEIAFLDKIYGMFSILNHKWVVSTISNIFLYSPTVDS